jgi:formylmethanofuran dehydrogenase subunit E
MSKCLNYYIVSSNLKALDKLNLKDEYQEEHCHIISEIYSCISDGISDKTKCTKASNNFGS